MALTKLSKRLLVTFILLASFVIVVLNSAFDNSIIAVSRGTQTTESDMRRLADGADEGMNKDYVTSTSVKATTRVATTPVPTTAAVVTTVDDSPPKDIPLPTNTPPKVASIRTEKSDYGYHVGYGGRTSANVDVKEAVPMASTVDATVGISLPTNLQEVRSGFETIGSGELDAVEDMRVPTSMLNPIVGAQAKDIPLPTNLDVIVEMPPKVVASVPTEKLDYGYQGGYGGRTSAHVDAKESVPSAGTVEATVGILFPTSMQEVTSGFDTIGSGELDAVVDMRVPVSMPNPIDGAQAKDIPLKTNMDAVLEVPPKVASVPTEKLDYGYHGGYGGRTSANVDAKESVPMASMVDATVGILLPTSMQEVRSGFETIGSGEQDAIVDMRVPMSMPTPIVGAQAKDIPLPTNLDAIVEMPPKVASVPTEKLDYGYHGGYGGRTSANVDAKESVPSVGTVDATVGILLPTSMQEVRSGFETVGSGEQNAIVDMQVPMSMPNPIVVAQAKDIPLPTNMDAVLEMPPKVASVPTEKLDYGYHGGYGGRTSAQVDAKDSGPSVGAMDSTVDILLPTSMQEVRSGFDTIGSGESNGGMSVPTSKADHAVEFEIVETSMIANSASVGLPGSTKTQMISASPKP